MENDNRYITIVGELNNKGRETRGIWEYSGAINKTSNRHIIRIILGER